MQESDLVKVYSNGSVMRSPSLINGEIIVAMDDNARMISVMMKAAAPDLSFFCSVFDALTSKEFMQYKNHTKQLLCPVCLSTKSASDLSRIGTMKWVSDEDLDQKQEQHCSVDMHKVVGGGRPKDKQNSMDDYQCRTHSWVSHDFFMNYRVDTEGNSSKHSSVHIYVMLVTFIT